MSTERRFKRTQDENRRRAAEIRKGKELAARIYFDWKSQVLVTKPIQTDLRQSIMDAMARLESEIPFELVRLPYLRGFQVMLDRVGGTIKSADDLFDEAMGEKKPAGPSEESLAQAMEMLGMKPPPTATPAPVTRATDAGAEAPAPPRYRRTFTEDGAPPTANPSGGTPDSPDGAANPGAAPNPS